MILRKLSNDISSANWSAVLIELLIIVIGVYGAFQVERWGEDRRESREERVLLEQLHNEIELAYPAMEAQLLENRDLVTRGQEVANILMQPVGSGELNDEQCDVIFSISILRRGKHSQLDDRELRALLFTLKSKMHAMEVFSHLIRPQQNILMDMYPELMPRGVDSNGERFINCDADGMRTSQAFINHLMSNLGRNGGLSASKGREFEALQHLHEKLDEVLETSGPEETSLHN